MNHLRQFYYCCYNRNLQTADILSNCKMENAFVPIFVTDLGIVTVERAVPLKALSPMLNNLFGKITSIFCCYP